MAENESASARSIVDKSADGLKKAILESVGEDAGDAADEGIAASELAALFVQK